MLHKPEIYRVDYKTDFCGQKTLVARLQELINTIQYFLVLAFPERSFVGSWNENENEKNEIVNKRCNKILIKITA